MSEPGLVLYHIPQSRSITVLWMIEEIGRPYRIEQLDVNKNEQRGVNQPFNMAVLAAALLAAAVAGLLDRTFLVWAIITVPTSLVGARLGLMLYGRVNDAVFRQLVVVLLGLSGAALIASSLR